VKINRIRDIIIQLKREKHIETSEKVTIAFIIIRKPISKVAALIKAMKKKKPSKLKRAKELYLTKTDP
jgi:hypothetical protein